jgi:hypothetical protein
MSLWSKVEKFNRKLILGSSWDVLKESYAGSVKFEISYIDKTSENLMISKRYTLPKFLTNKELHAYLSNWVPDVLDNAKRFDVDKNLVEILENKLEEMKKYVYPLAME